MLGCGRSLDKPSTVRAREMERKQTLISMPLIVYWPSPNLMPSRYSTLKLLVEIRQFSARILYIWIVATRVHRPWRMMLGMAMTFRSLLVKGAATEASPSLRVGGSSSLSSFSIMRAGGGAAGRAAGGAAAAGGGAGGGSGGA